MRQHLPTMPQDEPRVMTRRCRHVAQLHPPLGLPPQVLDVFSIQMRAARDSRRAVILFDAFVDNETAFDEVACHRRARIRRRMLNVGPVHVPTGEGEIGGNRIRRVIWIADNEAADDDHAMAVQDVNGVNRGVPRPAPALARPVLRVRFEKRQVVVQDILDAEKDVAESGALHQRREGLSMCRDRRCHPLHQVVDVR